MAEKLNTTRRAVLSGLAASPIAILPAMAIEADEALEGLRAAVAKYRQAQSDHCAYREDVKAGRAVFCHERNRAHGYDVWDANAEISRLAIDLVERPA